MKVCVCGIKIGQVGVVNIIPANVVHSAVRWHTVGVQIEKRLQKVLDRGISGNTVVNDSLSGTELTFEIVRPSLAIWQGGIVSRASSDRRNYHLLL